MALDGWGVHYRRGRIKRFLERAAKVTGLTIFAGPEVHEEPHPQGIVFIAESHIFAAVWGDVAVVDVVSCREFPAMPILELAERTFGGRWIARWLPRGRLGS